MFLNRLLFIKGLPSSVTLHFNKPIKALPPILSNEPFNYNTDNEDYEAVKLWQDKSFKNSDTQRDSITFVIGSTIPIQRDDDGCMG